MPLCIFLDVASPPLLIPLILNVIKGNRRCFVGAARVCRSTSSPCHTDGSGCGSVGSQGIVDRYTTDCIRQVGWRAAVDGGQVGDSAQLCVDVALVFDDDLV